LEDLTDRTQICAFAENQISHVALRRGHHGVLTRWTLVPGTPPGRSRLEENSSPIRTLLAAIASFKPGRVQTHDHLIFKPKTSPQMRGAA
jgi:hypothetical protein